MSVYWSLLHDFIMDYFKNDPLGQFQQILVHSVPGFVGMVHTYMTKSRLDQKLLIPLLKLGIGYLMINFTQTKIMGEPVYPFLPWDSIQSPLIGFMLLFMFSFMYLAMCWIDAAIKGGALSKVPAKKC
mmetsp:Transcript_2524/g.4241  ORF Transcript_2524/g.4241 Transcript_2524/m.4241 type:complete len:128 (-) Transcript_2524:123-506(-)|eukprot:CAMPEP_0168613388 /NCGR_PEP_ID=MMETSP0449_2-20121227/3424_1 /TAXON_ID=1082188 /ORGANISM="Strombidium rassoulzadegani, Strain ras09" /LENGTH=127 /DNA_ID=CAMNT_0008654017 /DNA_START=407 /DNA_END=790 /DNA_ORIENTATION=+